MLAGLSEIMKNISKIKEATKATDPEKAQLDALLEELVAELESNRSGPGSHFESSWQKPLALVQALAIGTLEKLRPGSGSAKGNLEELFAWEGNLNHYRYISVLDEKAVEGYEAPVVIGTSKDEFEVISPSLLLCVSRALMHSILIVKKGELYSEGNVTETLNRLGAKRLTLLPDVPS